MPETVDFNMDDAIARSQRAIDSQGYLVISRIGDPLPIGTILGASTGDSIIGQVVVVDTATREEYMEQWKNFGPGDKLPLCYFAPEAIFYKVKAE